jgi:hypothetical protein
MRCTDAFVHHIKILNFNLKMTDSIHSIYSPYQTLVKKIYIFKFFLLFFLGQEKIA